MLTPPSTLQVALVRVGLPASEMYIDQLMKQYDKGDELPFLIFLPSFPAYPLAPSACPPPKTLTRPPALPLPLALVLVCPPPKTLTQPPGVRPSFLALNLTRPPGVPPAALPFSPEDGNGLVDFSEFKDYVTW